jgi:hypothetical protein
MRRHAAPEVRFGGLRGLWPDHNPLRRRCDRAEAAFLAALLAGFVIGAPLTAMTAGRWAYDEGLRTERAELARWHQVPAVLSTTASQRHAGSVETAWAQWTAPGGAQRRAWVPAPAGAVAGTRVMVWVNLGGWLRGPPLRPSQVAAQAVLEAISTLLAFVVVVLCTGLLVHCLIERRRLAAWHAEWRVIGPNWSRHG